MEPNLIVILMLVLILVLFLGLYMSAYAEDKTDQVRRSVCFLIDNYPTSNYSYLVIVYTGRRLDAGTTSNVGIMIEGTEATSVPHILRDWNKSLMEMGGQDWFVINTRRPLGQIYCLHLWTDFSGVLPSWHCEKIIIHDIQMREVWFFKVNKWFHPLHGDGSMAYSIYQTKDQVVFSTLEKIEEVIVNEFDCGMHCWFSIFFKHPYSNYTRKERVGVAFAHAMILLYGLALVGHFSDVGELFAWTSVDFLTGFYAVLFAMPFHAFLVFIFRCTKPRPHITETSVDWASSVYSFFSYGMYQASNYVSESMPNLIPVTKSDKAAKGNKRVNFVEDIQRASDTTLRSRYSKERLKQAAGSSQVVPFRDPGSELERTSSDIFETSDLFGINDPVYGQELVEPSFCLPVWFNYVSWTVLVLVSAACLLSVSTFSLSYSWSGSLHFIASFFSAMFLSMFLIEPIKLTVFALAMYFFTKTQITIEDRSDLVHALAPGYNIPKLMLDEVITLIDTLRKEKIYTRLSNEIVSKLVKGKVCNVTIKFVLADAILVLMVFLITMWILNDVTDHQSYYTYTNVDKLVSGKLTFHRDILNSVKNTDDFIHSYLNNTLIASVCPSQDDTNRYENRLVGIVRLRQLRLTPRACRRGDDALTRKCIEEFETRNFADGWIQNSSKTPKPPWVLLHPDFVSNANNSRYPSASYVATLGRGREESFRTLAYLIDKKWFDWLTKAIFVDFTLFNPNTLHLSLVTLLAEYTDQLRVYKQIDVVKLSPLNSDFDLVLLPLVFILLSMLEVFLYNKYRKYSNIKPLSFFGTRSYQNKAVVAVFGLILFVLYMVKLSSIRSNLMLMADVENGTKSQYLNFSFMKSLDDCLKLTVGIIISFVLFDICIVLPSQAISISYLAAINAASRLISVTVAHLVLVTAFSLGLYMMLKNHWYEFASCPFIFTFTSSVRKFNTNVVSFDTLSLSGILLMLACFATILVVVVIRCLMVVTVFHAYSDIDIEPGKSRLVYTQRFKEKYNLESQPNLPNNTAIKAILAKSALESKLRTIGLLFLNFYYEQSRNGSRIHTKYKRLSMIQIANEIIRCRHLNLHLNEEDYLNESELARKKMETAKAITRTIIITKALINKVNYMEAKTDDILRKIRHDILTKSQSPKLKGNP